MFFKKNHKEKALLKAMYQRVDGKPLKYVTKRADGSYDEAVIGKDGRICINDTHITIMCNGTLVFKALLSDVKLGELMSLEGVTIEETNKDTGETQKIVAYYKYYRKT